MKRNILVLVMLAISMVGLTACQTKNDQMVHLVSGEVTSVYQEKGIGPADIAQSGGHLYVPDLQGSRILEFAVDK